MRESVLNEAVSNVADLDAAERVRSIHATSPHGSEPHVGKDATLCPAEVVLYRMIQRLPRAG